MTNLKIEDFIQLKNKPLISQTIQEAEENIVLTLIFKKKEPVKIAKQQILPLFSGCSSKPVKHKRQKINPKNRKGFLLSTEKGVDVYDPDLIEKLTTMRLNLGKTKKFVGYGVFIGDSNLSIRHLRDGKIKFTADCYEFCQKLKTVLNQAKKLVSSPAPLQIKIIYQ